ncbi:hypothetical protein D3C81_1829310 [compost metagenome]
MIPANIKRPADCTGYEVKDHWETCTGLGGELLQHVQKSLRAGGVDNTCTSYCCTVANPCRTVFTVSCNQLNVMQTARFHLIQILSNFRGRRNRKIPHDVVIDLSCCRSSHFISGFEVCYLLGKFNPCQLIFNYSHFFVSSLSIDYST